MVNKFIDSVTIALHKEFGDGYTNYVENVEQNFKKPCFVVSTLNPMITAVNARKYRRTIPFVIYFFTEKENTFDLKKDCYAIAERLFETLEYLPVGKYLIRGHGMEWQIVDNVLQFFITYTFECTREEEVYLMEEGTYNGSKM